MCAVIFGSLTAGTQIIHSHSGHVFHSELAASSSAGLWLPRWMWDSLTHVSWQLWSQHGPVLAVLCPSSSRVLAQQMRSCNVPHAGSPQTGLGRSSCRAFSSAFQPRLGMFPAVGNSAWQDLGELMCFKAKQHLTESQNHSCKLLAITKSWAHKEKSLTNIGCRVLGVGQAEQSV